MVAGWKGKAGLIRHRRDDCLFGVKYHPDHVGRLLGQIGWSCQRPTTRAIQRDEKAIWRWKQETWPRLKKALKEDRIIVFIDESGLSQKPHRGKTRNEAAKSCWTCRAIALKRW